MRLSAGQLSRLGAIALVLGFVMLSVKLSANYTVVPEWLVYADAASFIAIVGSGAFFSVGSSWRRLEHISALVAVAVAIAIVILTLARLVDLILIAPQTVKPLPLMQSSVGLWVANILAFTLTYWLIDAGGPDAREIGAKAYGDFDFPARSDPQKVEPGWQPSIVDYLFLGFTTSTAFGPTEAMPLTSRAKLLLMAQSLISLVTIAGVAARAIGTVP